MLLYLHSQEIAECACCNLEVMTQLINKHINLTFITPCDEEHHPLKWRQLSSHHYVGEQINMGPLY